MLISCLFLSFQLYLPKVYNCSLKLSSLLYSEFKIQFIPSNQLKSCLSELSLKQGSPGWAINSFEKHQASSFPFASFDSLHDLGKIKTAMNKKTDRPPKRLRLSVRQETDLFRITVCFLFSLKLWITVPLTACPAPFRRSMNGIRSFRRYT